MLEINCTKIKKYFSFAGLLQLARWKKMTIEIVSYLDLLVTAV